MSTTEKTAGQAIGDLFRQTAGLPKRKNDKPVTNDGDAAELKLATEPEGGYGGKDGIDNQGSLRRNKTAAEGTDLVGTEFGEGKTDGGKTAKKSIARKKAIKAGKPDPA